MLRRIVGLTVLLMVGCSSAPLAPTADIQRFEAFVESNQIRVEPARIQQAAQQVLRAYGLRPGRPKPYAGRTLIKAVAPVRQPGATPHAGCQVEIFPQPTGTMLRATCYRIKTVRQPGGVGMPKRVDWEDRYLVARVMALANPTRAGEIWSLEPTGYQTRRCAYLTAGTAAMPPECARSRRRR